MLKLTVIREEDYWIFVPAFLAVLCGATVMYAPIFSVLLPALIMFAALLAFTTHKIRRDYSEARGRLHVALVIAWSAILALIVYLLTN